MSVTNIVDFSARNSTCVMHPVMMLMVAWQNIEGELSTSQFWEKIFRTIISQSRILELCVQAWGHIFLHQIEEGASINCVVSTIWHFFGFTSSWLNSNSLFWQGWVSQIYLGTLLLIKGSWEKLTSRNLSDYWFFNTFCRKEFLLYTKNLFFSNIGRYIYAKLAVFNWTEKKLHII